MYNKYKQELKIKNELLDLQLIRKGKVLPREKMNSEEI